MTAEKARALRILSVYDNAVYRFNGSLAIYCSVVAAGYTCAATAAADYWAPLVRQDAAAIVATIAECTPEGGH